MPWAVAIVTTCSVRCRARADLRRLVAAMLMVVGLDAPMLKAQGAAFLR